MNPPWNLWKEAAEKLLQSRCKAICVVPAWSKPWVWDLVCAATTRIYAECGTRLFRSNGKNCPATNWGTWILRIDGENRNNHTRYDALGGVHFLPRWRPPPNETEEHTPAYGESTQWLEEEEERQNHLRKVEHIRKETQQHPQKIGMHSTFSRAPDPSHGPLKTWDTT